MDLKLELVVIPVSDVDRAKDFQLHKAHFNVEVDHRAGHVRVVSCPSQAPHARSRSCRTRVRRARGVETSELFHFDAGRQVPGPNTQRSSHGAFSSGKDPDGTGWLGQRVKRSESTA